ncbi:MAG TPA: hypothetical protein VGU73_08185 [Acidimicrobiia bacterium]|nr:hypothetical protein [Acidimicrobiia bacterium]
MLTTLVAAAAMVAILAGPGSAAVPAKKTPPACADGTTGAAVKAIKAAYNTVLNGSTGLTLAQKTAAIQDFDDPAFQALFSMIAQQEASMLATTSVQVNTVKCVSKTSANVKYTLVLSGKPTPNLAPPGNAVVYESMWRVSKSTICDLFSLLNPSIATSGPCATP